MDRQGIFVIVVALSAIVFICVTTYAKGKKVKEITTQHSENSVMPYVADDSFLIKDIEVKSYVWANEGKTYMTINQDGVLEFGKDVTPKEAAKELAMWFYKFVREAK